MIVAGFVGDLDASETEALEPLAEALSNVSNRLRSWGEIGELLAAKGFEDALGRPFKRERLILLAVAAAGGKRFVLGTPGDARAAADDRARLYDLLNLPAEIGGRGGFAPIVRSCFDGELKYARTWRFATSQDCLTVEPVVDEVDGDGIDLDLAKFARRPIAEGAHAADFEDDEEP